MNIVIRVDSSITIGSGHVMRCVTLADQLRKQGVTTRFICRELPGNMCGFIEGKGYEVYKLPHNAEVVHSHIDAEQTSLLLQKISVIFTINWIIVDHYALNIQWEQKIRPYTEKIMVIDDLADRYHDCDLLLDQNLYIDMQTRYDGLIPKRCQLLLGPQYVLLRREFYEKRITVKERDGIVKRILVFFGSSDPTNETTKALHAIQLLNKKDICVDVIVGTINPFRAEIKAICNEMCNTTFYCQVDNMAELMVKADLAIGAGGTATWERSFLGLPALTIVVADNQLEMTKAIAQTGAIINLGWYTDVSSTNLYEKLADIMQSKERLLRMSQRSFDLSTPEIGRTIIEYILG